MIELTTELRPCLVGPDKDKCLFHGIWQSSAVIGPSLMKGGHNGGTISNPIAVVENEKGELFHVDPIDIQFVDNKMAEYSFGDEKEDINSG